MNDPSDTNWPVRHLRMLATNGGCVRHTGHRAGGCRQGFGTPVEGGRASLHRRMPHRQHMDWGPPHRCVLATLTTLSPPPRVAPRCACTGRLC